MKLLYLPVRETLIRVLSKGTDTSSSTMGSKSCITADVAEKRLFGSLVGWPEEIQICDTRDISFRILTLVRQQPRRVRAREMKKVIDTERGLFLFLSLTVVLLTAEETMRMRTPSLDFFIMPLARTETNTLTTRERNRMTTKEAMIVRT